MMKAIYRVWMFVLGMGYFGIGLNGQGVNIGSNQPPHPTATLEVSGSQGGFLLPRLTTAQRNQLGTPSIGLVIYNLTTECVESYFPSGWGTLRCNCTNPPPVPSQITGPLAACPGSGNLIFSVTPVAGATSYQWTISGQDTLVQGQGTNSITVHLSANPGNRTIQVAAVNGCGSSSDFSFTMAVSPPSASFSVNPSTVVTNNPASFTPAQPGVTYAWTFAGGTPASSVAANPLVTWTSPGTYAVGLTVIDGAGCTTTSTQNVTVSNCAPQSWTFTNCGASGRNGPSQSQCNTAYGSGVVSVSSGIQLWTVPATGTYRITVNGAQGGNGGGRTGGLGASMRGDFTLTAGSVIKILVGQQGGSRVGSSNEAGAGGGGSFVTLNDNTPLIVAGGGGGGGASQNGLPGSTSLNGTASGFSSGQGGINGGGGGGGQNGSAGTQSSPGGSGTSCSYGAGGGGFYTNGGENCGGSSPNIKGFSFLNGGLGGPADPGTNGVEGGFGGGAGVGHRAAGGGGWSGGGGDGDSYGGGGGGSYNNGTNPSNASGTQSGHGTVVIQRICP